MTNEEYYTPEEISNKLKVPQGTVYHWIRNGLLYADRYGRVLRIPKSALEEFRQPASEKPKTKKNLVS